MSEARFKIWRGEGEEGAEEGQAGTEGDQAEAEKSGGQED